jgi:hypothetical protein
MKEGRRKVKVEIAEGQDIRMRRMRKQDKSILL